MSSSLVMVKGLELQQLLGNFTNDIYDSLWLGGRFDSQTLQFMWEDGEPVTYTNWQDGYPKYNTDSCIELRPHDSKHLNKTTGKWADVACQKRNRILCQKELSWSLTDAVNEIRQLRQKLKEETTLLQNEAANMREATTLLQNETANLREATKNLQQTNTALTTEVKALNASILPIGLIYIEYYAQASPQTLWPSATWNDVTDEYSGLFFRALGGNSESWGLEQNECAPRITEMEYKEKGSQRNTSNKWPSPNTISANGWSSYGFAGYSYWNPHDQEFYEALRFNTADCEVRPKNQAIRIWKRIG